jgi:hypothetical protein
VDDGPWNPNRPAVFESGMRDYLSLAGLLSWFLFAALMTAAFSSPQPTIPARPEQSIS